MKLKYYLRGLGIGIIVTTVVLAISFAGRQKTLSDAEIIARAKELGMVMPETETATENSETDLNELLDQADEGSTDKPEDSAVQTETQTPENGADVTVDSEADGAEPMADSDADADSEVVGDSEADVSDEPESSAPAAAGGSDNEWKKSYFLTIQPGDVCRVVCEDLAAHDVISDSEELRKYLSKIGYASNMSIGIYEIPYGLTMEEVAQILKAGPIEK